MTATILKRNEYKCIERLHDSSGEDVVVKRFTGHDEAAHAQNAHYTFRGLSLIDAEFRGVVRTARPIRWEASPGCVVMEYLPELDRSRRLTLSDMPLTEGFFEACHGVRDDRGFLATIRDSVRASPAVQELVEQGFPLALGFKGDLRENLRVLDGGLLLVDVDDICLEPLGLSELVLYAELYAQLRPFGSLRGELVTRPCPNAARALDPVRWLALEHAALETLDWLMRTAPRPLRSVKRALAARLLARLRRRCPSVS